MSVVFLMCLVSDHVFSQHMREVGQEKTKGFIAGQNNVRTSEFGLSDFNLICW